MGEPGDQEETKTLEVADSPSEASAAELLPRGSTFGRYVVLEHLATGGMGEI